MSGVRADGAGLAACALLGLLALPCSAQAQIGRNDIDPAEGAQFRSGTLAWSPALVFSSGYDTNVYREPAGFRDYENFVVPQIEGWWVHPGFFVKVNAAAEMVRFNNNVGATNSQVGIDLERRRSLVRPWVSYDRRRTAANPFGFEAGYKSLRLENDINGGLKLRLSPRSEARIFGRLTRTGWDADAIYQGSVLRENLNRTTSAIGGSYIRAITQLTGIGASVDVSTDRFKFAPRRNGETLNVRGQVEFASPALIFGTASVGYRRFVSSNSGAANNNGLSSQVNIGYGAADGTLIKFSYGRETQYSLDASLAYFVLTSYSVSAARRVGTMFDAAVFANRFGLDYRPSGLFAGAGRVDIGNEYGTAVAYRVGRRGRIGVSAERSTKTGPWGYQATRLVGFLTYGSGRFQRLDRPTPFER
jgi:hypothetical protein